MRWLALVTALGAAAAVGWAQEQAPTPSAPAPSAPAPSAPAPWTLGGSLLVQPLGSYASSTFSYGSSSTLGLDFEAGGGRARAEASIEAAVLTGASASLAWLVAATPYGRPDELLLPASPGSGDVALAGRIRTAYGKLDLDWMAFTLGRQVVNYGRGTLWSPTDIFTELDLSGISPVRRGTDAMRATLPIGQTAGFDLVAAPTLAPEGGRYSARANALIADVLDAAVVAARDGADKGWVFGGDFKTDIEVGLTGEASYFQPDAGGWGWVRAAAGVDWSVGDFILAAEYYYNGGGGAADLLFPATHNAYASATWTPSELLQASLTVVADIGQATGTATLLVRASAAQNADLTVFVRGGNGTAGNGVDYGLNGQWVAQAGLGLEVKF
ncbi:MAG TPA: hypothetical protein VMF68_06865 [Spirochaetia bacterium]|nr:hypothetical protein [Spirochaetia bacterium]